MATYCHQLIAHIIKLVHAWMKLQQKINLYIHLTSSYNKGNGISVPFSSIKPLLSFDAKLLSSDSSRLSHIMRQCCSLDAFWQISTLLMFSFSSFPRTITSPKWTRRPLLDSSPRNSSVGDVGLALGLAAFRNGVTGDAVLLRVTWPFRLRFSSYDGEQHL